MTTETASGRHAVTELRVWRESLASEVGPPVQLPEPHMVLNLASRSGSEVREFKHIHQMSMMHRANLVQASKVKHLYLVDGFLSLVDSENPVALYALARSMFELSAFLYAVQVRLQDVVLRLDRKNWKPLGEKFFGLVIRARYATTNPQYRAMLRAEGVSEARLKPFGITQCIETLAREPAHEDALARYEILCDFVHHNMSSSSVANSGSGIVDAVRTAAGGELRSASGELTITQYEYPVYGKTERAINELAPDFLRDARACFGWLNAIPSSPFPIPMVEAVTGTTIGIPRLDQ